MRNPSKSIRRAIQPAIGILGIASALAAHPCLAATWTGINAGLPSSAIGVNSIVVAPKTPSTIYATTFSLDGSGHAFKSTDAGASWKALSSLVGVNSVLVDAQNSSVVYALTGRGILKSTNGGDNWATANAGLPDSYVSSLVIDPVNTSNLYAVTGQGPFKSTDGGASWNAIAGLPPNTSFGNLVIDPAASSTIYAIGSSFTPPGPPASVILKSSDGGATWSALNAGLPSNASLRFLAVGVPSTIYAIGALAGPAGQPGQAVFKSTDGGANFTTLDTGVPSGAAILSLTLDPKDATVIYLAVLFPFAEAGGILKSSDGGKSWRSLSPGLPANTPIQSLTVDPATSSTIYVIADHNIYRSADGGTRWTKAATGLSAVNIGVVAVNRVDASTVFAGASDSLFKSVDNGATWSRLFSFQTSSSPVAFISPPFPLIAPVYLRSLLIDFSNPDTLYAATYRPNSCYFADNLLFKSTDGGASWSDSVSPDRSGCVLGGPFGPSAGLKTIDPTDSNTLYVAETDDEDGGYWLLRSNDAGTSWKPVSGGFPQAGVWALAVDPTDPATLYAGLDDIPTYSDDGTAQPGAGGIFKSTDGGATWNLIFGLNGAAMNLLVVDPTQPGVLYAAAEGNYTLPRGFRGLVKSTDSGASWSPADSGLGALHNLGATMTALVIDPSNTNLLYAGTSGGGVFKSSDAGGNWGPFNDGLANLDVHSLVIAPGSQHILYAGTSGGVFRITDDAR